MTVSILVVEDEADVASLFRQHFRREVRRGTDVLHFANSGEEALGKLGDGIEPQLIVILSDINMPGTDGLQLRCISSRSASASARKSRGFLARERLQPGFLCQLRGQ